MKPENKSGLAIVFSNSQPEREARHPQGWILITSDHQFNVLVCHDAARGPRVIRKEAA